MILNPWLRDSPLTHANKSLEKGCDPGINSFLLMQPFVQLPLCRQPFYDWFSLPADSRNHHTVGFCLKKAFIRIATCTHKTIQISLTFKCLDARLTKAIFYGHSTRTNPCWHRIQTHDLESSCPQLVTITLEALSQLPANRFGVIQS